MKCYLILCQKFIKSALHAIHSHGGHLPQMVFSNWWVTVIHCDSSVEHSMGRVQSVCPTVNMWAHLQRSNDCSLAQYFCEGCGVVRSCWWNMLVFFIPMTFTLIELTNSQKDVQWIVRCVCCSGNIVEGFFSLVASFENNLWQHCQMSALWKGWLGITSKMENN